MVKRLFIICIMAGSIAVQGITLSKDSLKVYNNFFSSFADELILVNGTDEAVSLDSAFLLIEEMDTTGLLQDITENRLQARWREVLSSSIWFLWDLKSAGENRYRLTFVVSTPSDSQPLYFDGPAAQRGIAMLSIGGCLNCSGPPPRCPSYFKGTLELYFSNRQTILIRLYSDDLRKQPQDGKPCSDYPCDSLAVRKILDRNGMEKTPVAWVSTKANGRITSLQFRYSAIPMDAITLPKPVTVISDEIGSLTALTNFSTAGNAIESISNRIGRCVNLRSFMANGNGITALPDSIVNCSSLQFLSLDKNLLTRLPDSIGKLKSLKSLSIAENLLTSLPESIVEIDGIECVFIAGNRICNLPEAVEIWLSDVKSRTLCARYEPVWPDSQKCNFATAGVLPLSRKFPGFTIQRLARRDNSIMIEVDEGQGAISSIEIFDFSGRRIWAVKMQSGMQIPKTLQVNTTCFPAGWYYLRIISTDSNMMGCSLVLER